MPHNARKPSTREVLAAYWHHLQQCVYHIGWPKTAATELPINRINACQ